MIKMYVLRLLRILIVQKYLLPFEMKTPRIKLSRRSPDVLYVPFYMRSFSVCEKIIIVLSIFVSSMAVSSIPLGVATLSSTQTPESTVTMTHSGEAE